VILFIQKTTQTIDRYVLCQKKWKKELIKQKLNKLLNDNEELRKNSSNMLLSNNGNV